MVLVHYPLYLFDGRLLTYPQMISSKFSVLKYTFLGFFPYESNTVLVRNLIPGILHRPN